MVRRRLRRAAWVLGALVLLLVLVVGGAFLYLRSASGGELLRSKLLDGVNGAIAGKLEAGKASLWGERLVLEDLRLFTPEGELVAEVKRLDVLLDIPAVALAAIRLREAKLDGVTVLLHVDERGLGLSRAIEPKVQQAKEEEEKQGPGARWTIDVASLAVAKMLVEYRDADRTVRLEGLSGGGEATVHTGELDVKGKLELRGAMAEPLRDAFALRLRASSPSKGKWSAELFAQGGGLLLDASLDPQSQTLAIKKAAVRQTLGQALLPDAWPAVDAEAIATLRPKGGEAQLSLGEAGRARARATWDLEGDARGGGAEVWLEDVDLSKLREGLPATALGGTLSGTFADFRPATLTGKVQAKGQWREKGGGSVLELDAQLDAREGLVKLEPVTLDLPGAHLEVKGTASQARLDLRGRLRADDAGLAGRTLAHAAGLEIPALSAKGTLDLALEGPAVNPSVRVSGKLSEVALGELSGTGVELSGALPSVRRWREVDATLGVERLFVGDTSFEAVRVGLETRGREVALDLTSKGLTALVARAGGRLEGDNALALSTLSLEYPGTVWTMAEPSRLSWEKGLDLGPVLLRAGTQALELEVHKPPGRIQATAKLTGVDAALLPSAFVPRSLGLAGLLSGKLSAEGPSGKPVLSAAVEWKAGKLRTVSGIDAKADARLEGGRAQGTLSASTALGRAQGNFDLPLRLGKAKPEEALALSVQLDEVPLEEVFAAAGTRAVLTGTVRLGATLQGTVGEPKLALDASTLGAAWRPAGQHEEVPLHSALVLVETRADGTPAVQLDLATMGGTLKLDASTPVRLAELLWRPPDAKELQGLQWVGALEVSNLSLLAVRAALPAALRPFEGTVAVSAQASGPLKAPTLEAQLKVAGLSSPDFKPIDLAVGVGGGVERTTAQVTAKVKDKTLLAVQAWAELPLRELATRADLSGERFQVEGNLGPLDVAEVAALRDAKTPVKGRVRASFEAKGTLGKPKAALRGGLEDLAVGKVALGKANLGWDYASAQNAVTLGMVSSNGGQLRARGEVTLDLSLPALKNGLSWKAAPVEAQLTARGFDLSFFSGVHAALRTVGGLLTADAGLEGKLGAPDFDGKVRWTKGRLGIAGTTELRDIELAVDATVDRISVEKLEARAGAGTLAFQGQTRRTRPGAWTFDGELQTFRFPLITDDQLRLILDVNARAEGEASELLWNVRRLGISEAHVQLPEVRKKDIQNLDRPKDIVLVRDGVALGPRPRRWKKVVKDAATAELERQRARVIRATLDAPRNLWVRSSDVNIEIGLSEGFTVEYDQQLYLNGEVKVQREGAGSRVNVLGRKFEVQRDSNVRFSGSPADPYLNVTAVHVNEKEKVTVFATLTGRGDDLAFKTSSRPPLPDSEIYTLLATGRRTLKRGGGGAMTPEQAASVLGAYVGNQLKTALAEKLPIELFDVFSIEAGTEGFRGTRLEAGKYLTDRIYIGYVGQVGADPRKGESGNAGRVEYQFAPGWSVQGTLGDAPAGSAELVWGIDF